MTSTNDNKLQFFKLTGAETRFNLEGIKCISTTKRSPLEQEKAYSFKKKKKRKFVILLKQTASLQSTSYI